MCVEEYSVILQGCKTLLLSPTYSILHPSGIFLQIRIHWKSDPLSCGHVILAERKRCWSSRNYIGLWENEFEWAYEYDQQKIILKDAILWCYAMLSLSRFRYLPFCYLPPNKTKELFHQYFSKDCCNSSRRPSTVNLSSVRFNLLNSFFRCVFGFSIAVHLNLNFFLETCFLN